MDRKRIVVIGTGYVGLPAALMLAKAGHEVIGVDINENIVRAINERVLLIDEEALQALMDDPAVQANLVAQTTATHGDIFIIAVPTPVDERRKIAVLDYVVDATRSIAGFLKPGNLVILESTVPPMTCREVMTPIIEAEGLKVGEDIYLAHCPERILPGDIFHEIVHNHRIIGAADETSRQLAKEMYASFVEGDLLLTDDVTAELAKLMENTYRDVNIALANEFAAVTETLGIDANEAIALANKHPRVNILSPGIGVGGHCIPIDPWFIKEADPANSRLIFVAREVNDEQPLRIAAKIRQAVAGIESPRLVAIGAAYKPNTEDKRESPAIRIVEALKTDGYNIAHYDPLVPSMALPGALATTVKDADALLVLVPHRVVLAELERDRAAIEAAMRTPKVLVFGA